LLGQNVSISFSGMAVVLLLGKVKWGE